MGVFGHQSPYIEIIYNNEKFVSSTKEKSGLDANWNETFDLELANEESTLKFQAFGKNLLQDDFLGETITIDYKEIMKKGIKTENLYENENVKRLKGKIYYRIDVKEKVQKIKFSSLRQGVFQR